MKTTKGENMLNNNEKEMKIVEIVQEVLLHEEQVASKYNITVEQLQEWKRGYFIKNNSLRFEYDKLQSTMLNLQTLKPLLYTKIYHTGMLFQKLAREVYARTEDKRYTLTDHYVLASYYANFGFLAIENSIYKENYTTKKDEEIIKRHVHIGADLLESKGLTKIANIVKRHHEKPNASGYLGEQNTNDVLLGLLNIADVFVDSIVPSKKPEMALVFEEAVEESLKGYQTGLLFDVSTVEIINDSLADYYKHEMRI